MTEEEWTEEGEERKSKSQVKREMLLLQEYGQRLVELSEDRLRAIEMPEKLREAVLLARTITSHGAKRRQIHYIGALLREIDTAPIIAILDNADEVRLEETRRFRQAETWRDRLLAGEESILEEVFDRFPHSDRQHLRQLMRNALREKSEGRPPRSARELYRALHELLEQEP